MTTCNKPSRVVSFEGGNWIKSFVTELLNRGDSDAKDLRDEDIERLQRRMRTFRTKQIKWCSEMMWDHIPGLLEWAKFYNITLPLTFEQIGSANSVYPSEVLSVCNQMVSHVLKETHLRLKMVQHVVNFLLTH
jgi:hypothetical protein